jgi:hypothetical protein
MMAYLFDWRQIIELYGPVEYFCKPSVELLAAAHHWNEILCMRVAKKPIACKMCSWLYKYYDGSQQTGITHSYTEGMTNPATRLAADPTMMGMAALEG